MKETRSQKIAVAIPTAGSLCGATVAVIVYLLAALGSLSLVSQAFAQSGSAGVRLQAGIAKEDVDGDLKSAMAIYQKVADDRSAPREVRAKALMRLAGCYEKLGGQAKRVYEELVRDYADQPVAAQARVRLASLAREEHPSAPPSMTARRIEWSNLGKMRWEDTDGHRAVYQDASGSLYYGDLAGQSKRLVFKSPGDPGDWYWTPSRDFSMVLLDFYPKPGHPRSMAVVKTDGSGYREIVRDDAQGTILGSRLGGVAWSWDSRYLLVWTYPYNGDRRLLLISVADGQRRELLKIASGKLATAAFSPDARFIAYEVAPITSEGGPSHIFLMPVQGGDPRLVYESAPRPPFIGFSLDQQYSLKDWTADGRNLVITDARTETTALYLLPVKNGASAGSPMLIRYEAISAAISTPDGGLVYSADTTGGIVDVQVASLGGDGHLGNWQHLDLRNRVGWPLYPQPSFSPDGSQIAYVTWGDDALAHPGELVLHDLATGRESLLYRSAQHLNQCYYSAATPEIYCSESASGGETKLFSVAVPSGSVEQLGSFREFRQLIPFAHDRYLYLRDRYAKVLRWEIAKQQETVVDPGAIVLPSLDDRWLLRGNGSSSPGSLSVRPLSSGEWRPLASNLLCCRPAFTADSAWVLYPGVDPAGKRGLFRVPTAGGQPERIGDLPAFDLGAFLEMSPDGHHILAVTYPLRQADMWFLENFTSPAKQ